MARQNISSSSSRVRFFSLIASLVIAAVGLFSFAGTRGPLDDMFIVLVHARHLLGEGRVFWNEADGPIEGFTSLLDVFVKSAGYLALPDDPVMAAFLSTVALHVSVGILGYGIAHTLARRAGQRHHGALALAIGIAIAASPSLASGSSYLLEAPLFAAIALAALAFVLAPRLTRCGLAVWGILLALLGIARPEGLLLACVLLGFFVLRYRRRPARLAPAIGIFVASMVALFAWRLAYFGYLAPNTYYAKRSSCTTCELQDGLAYALAFMSRPLGALVAVTCLAVPLIALVGGSRRTGGWREGDAGSLDWRGERAQFRALAVGTYACASFVVVILEGGDCYPGSRFFALASVLTPLVLLTAYAGLRSRWRHAFLAVVLLLGLAELGELARTSRLRIAYLRHSFPLGKATFACAAEVAAAIRGAAPAGSVAQSDYQRLKFFADELRVVDLHGLNDKRIAHRPFDGHVTFGKYRPEWGVEENAEVWVYGIRTFGHAVPMANFTMDEILTSPPVYEKYIGYAPDVAETAAAMARAYVAASIPVCNGYFNLLVRRDRVEHFAQQGFLVNGFPAASP